MGTNAKGVNSSAHDPAISDRFFYKYWLYHWIPLKDVTGIRLIVIYVLFCTGLLILVQLFDLTTTLGFPVGLRIANLEGFGYETWMNEAYVYSHLFVKPPCVSSCLVHVVSN